MAIDPVGVQQRLVEQAQRVAEAAEEAAQPPEAPVIDGGNDGAAPGPAFEQLLDADPGSMGNTGPEAALPVPSPPETPLSVGDRILANMAGPTSAPDVAGPVGARPGIDIGDPMDSLHVQMRVAEIKAEIGLAASAVQKSSSAADTLLKAQ